MTDGQFTCLPVRSWAAARSTGFLKECDQVAEILGRAAFFESCRHE